MSDLACVLLPRHLLLRQRRMSMKEQLQSCAARIAARIQNVSSDMDPEILQLPGGSVIATCCGCTRRARWPFESIGARKHYSSKALKAGKQSRRNFALDRRQHVPRSHTAVDAGLPGAVSRRSFYFDQTGNRRSPVLGAPDPSRTRTSAAPSEDAEGGACGESCA